MPPRGRKADKQPKKGQLQLVVKSGESIVTYAPFGADGKALNSAKAASDKVHATGYLMAKACTNCLGALRNYNETNMFGRGMNSFNEVFCCMVHKEHGNGGQQCGRCLGMNKGPGCVPPVAEAEPAARAVVAAAVEYNRIIVGKKTVAGKDFSTAEKAAIQKAVDISAAFFRINSGLLKSNVVEATPTKKRKYAELETTTALTGLGTKLTTQHHNLEELVSKLVTDVHNINNKLKDMTDELDEIKDTLAVARGRQAATLAGIGDLIMSVNGLARIANSERPEVEYVVLGDVPSFDPVVVLREVEFAPPAGSEESADESE